MQIFVKTLTGKTITLINNDVSLLENNLKMVVLWLIITFRKKQHFILSCDSEEGGMNLRRILFIK